MKKRRSLLHATLLLGFVTASLMAQEHQALGPKDGFDLPPVDLERVAVGATAPNFTLESKDGQGITLSDFRGKKDVVLIFYRGHW